MSIDYFFKDTTLLGKKGATAICTTKTYGIDEIAGEISTMQNFLTVPQIKAVIESFQKAILKCLLDGKRVSLENFITIFPSIKGMYDNKDVTVNAKTALNIKSTVAKSFIREIQNSVKLTRKSRITSGNIIYKVYNYNVNEQTELDKSIQVIVEGKSFTYNAENEEEGLFIVPETGDKIKISDPVYLTTKKLSIILPQEIKSGTAKLLFVSSTIKSELYEETYEITIK